VQICPVGALTAKPYRFRARPWDLDQVESTCTSCSVGCRVVIQASRNQVLRYLGVDIDPVNWSWMCDKGRFDFESVSHPDRLPGPLVRDGSELTTASWAKALDTAASALKAAAPEAIGVIGGARLTNEAAYAWAKLAKGVLGTDNVDAQLGDGLPAELVLGLPRATIDDVCEPGGTVLVLAPDLKEELPVLFLRVRDAVTRRKATVIELAPLTTGVTSIAAASLRYRPGEAAALVSALLGQGDAAPVEGDLAAARALVPNEGAFTVILGRPSLAESAGTIVDAASAILRARPDAKFLPALRRSNVNGALDMGLAPGLLPGRVTLDGGRQWFHTQWPGVPEERGLDTAGILEAAAAGSIDALVLLGADPLRDFPDRDLAARGIAGAKTVIAVTTYLDSSAAQADVVLAAAGYAETSGSTTNIEGRVSTVDQKVTPPGTARSDWELAAELAWRLEADLGAESAADLWDEVERIAPAHRGITRALLDSAAGADGVVVPLPAGEVVRATPVGVDGTAVPEDADVDTDSTEVQPPEAEAGVHAAADDGDDRPPLVEFTPNGSTAAVPPVDAYSLRLVTARKLYDEGTLVSHSPSIAALASPSVLRLNPYDCDRLGVDGRPAKVTSPRGSLTSDVVSDDGVPRGSAALTIAQSGTDPFLLIDAGSLVTEVRVESS